MPKASQRRASRRQRAEERLASRWGLHSVDWRRCRDPNYHCELACALHERGIIHTSTSAEHNQLVGALGSLLSVCSLATSRFTKENVANLIGGVRWGRQGGIAFIDNTGLDEIALQYADFYNEHGHYPEDTDHEDQNADPNTVIVQHRLNNLGFSPISLGELRTERSRSPSLC